VFGVVELGGAFLYEVHPVITSKTPIQNKVLSVLPLYLLYFL